MHLSDLPASPSATPAHGEGEGGDAKNGPSKKSAKRKSRAKKKKAAKLRNEDNAGANLNDAEQVVEG